MYDREEVRLHIEITSSVVKQPLIPGDLQPLVKQNRGITDQRLRDGDVGILNGLSKLEDPRALNRIPGLVYVPVLGKGLFGTGNTEKDLLIAVTPKVLRTATP